ncbi:hypothetical protein JMG10_02745 [Nostoc ellipsosporum NOK]|jgi:hypothetical protein|nr:hypothetical protein [Nostoc ellipsosporum NOK]
MKVDIRAMRAEFYSMANEVFQATYRSFRNDVAAVERTGHENVHQMIRSKYSNLLIRTLEHEAQVLIARCEGAGVKNELSTSLVTTIHFFLDEFLRKADEF